MRLRPPPAPGADLSTAARQQVSRLFLRNLGAFLLLDLLIFALLGLTRHWTILLAVEAALAGRGYENALCVVRQGEATVFTGAPLTAQDAALVQQLILEASGIAPENIRLSGF